MVIVNSGSPTRTKAFGSWREIPAFDGEGYLATGANFVRVLGNMTLGGSALLRPASRRFVVAPNRGAPVGAFLVASANSYAFFRPRKTEHGFLARICFLILGCSRLRAGLADSAEAIGRSAIVVKLIKRFGLFTG